jgi:hypothetical protein
MWLVPNNVFEAIFFPFFEIYIWENEILYDNFVFQIKSQKIATIAYNMKWCLRSFTFIL